MGDIRERSVQWERWVLDTPTKMTECLVELIGRGYRGSVTAGPSPDGSLVWLLEIGTSQPMAPVLANLGQVMILIGTRLEALTTDEYLSVYGDTHAA